MDVILQMHNQSYAHRVCLLAQNPRVSILPGGKFGESAEELGPKKSMHHGPNLVLLRNCTASKAEIIAHIHTTFLRRYVARIYWCHHTAMTKEAAAAQVAEDLCQLMKAPTAGTHSTGLTLRANGESQGKQFGDSDCETASRGVNGPVSESKSSVGKIEGTVAKLANSFGKDACSLSNTETESESRGNSLPALDGTSQNGESNVDTEQLRSDRHENGMATSERDVKLEGNEPESESRGEKVDGMGEESRSQYRNQNGNGEAVSDLETGHVEGGPPKVRLRTQACPKALETFFTDSIPDVEVGMARFTHVLGVAEVHAPSFGNSATKRWMYYYGISPAEDVYFQRDLRGGEGSEGRGTGDLQCLHEGSVSKAVCKMEEILEAVGWPLGRDTTVIDLGAAPGAWTAYLAGHVARVAAVDPAEMGADAMLENVTHIRKAALDAKDDLATWQRDQLSDLLVCDINKHPKEVLKWSEPLFPFLRPGGLFIMTLKFFGKARDKTEALKLLSPSLDKHFVDMDCIWLLANTVHERTLVARKR